MTTRNDERDRALDAYDGNQNDRQMAWLTAQGATTGNLNDRWMTVLTGLGFTTGNLNDRKLDYFESLGYTGALPDAEMEFWEAQP